MLAVDSINALDLSERCEALQMAVENGIIGLEVDSDSWDQWHGRKSSLTQEQMNSLVSLKNYSTQVISNAMSKCPSKKVRDVLSEFTSKTDWFREINETLSLHGFEETNNVTYALVFAPFLSQYMDGVIKSVRDSSIISDEVIEPLLLGASSIFQNLTIRTLIMELHAFEVSDNEISSEEKLKIFLSRFTKKDNLVSFYSRYPNLARRLNDATRRHIMFTLEVISNLQDNAKKIGINDDELIINLDFGAGDTHKGGRTVVKVTTNEDITFYYKPQSIEVETVYNEIIELLNSETKIEKLSTAKVIVFDDFSVSFEVPHKSCTSQDQVNRAFIRFGELLGISYLMNFTDLHMENLVVSGEHPVIVDGETFLANRLPITHENVPQAALEILELVSGFVTSSIILPSKLYLDSSMKSVDLGALSGGEQRIDNALVLKDIDNANIRFERDATIMPGAQNLVSLNGQIADYKDYHDQISSGFDMAIDSVNSISSQITELLSDKRGVETRVLVRATSTYGRLLDFTLHPSCMADRRESDKILENLYAMPGVSDEIYMAEYNDMMNDDIPYFTTRIDSEDLYTSIDMRIEGVFPEKSREIVINKINDASFELNAAQKTLISAKIQTDNLNKVRITDEDEYKFIHTEKNVIPMSSITAIADTSIEQSLRVAADRSISWLSLDEERDNNPAPLQNDLYSGLSGVGLFYHYLSKETGDVEYQDIVGDIEATVTRSSLSAAPGLSAYVGHFSSTYFGMKMLNDGSTSRITKSFVRENMSAIRKIVEAENWQDYSWLTGASSFLPLLTEYYSMNGDERWLSTAHVLAETLDDAVRREKFDGAGIAHGLLGPAVALARYGEVADSEYHMEYSARLLLQITNRASKEFAGIRSFCRGSSGLVVALSDGVQRGTIPQNVLVDYIESSNFLESRLMRTDSLCHGNSGLIDAAISAYNATRNSDYLKFARNVAVNMLSRRAENDGYNVKRFIGFPPVGLFKSETGIAYTLLRLRNPHLPSVSLLS